MRYSLMVPSLFVGLIQTQILSAQNSETEIRGLEHEWALASLHRDTAAFNHLMAPDYRQTLTDGTVSPDRSSRLLAFGSGRVRTAALDLSDISVRIDGNTAIVTGLAARKDTVDGRPRDFQYRYTRVWQRRSGRWQVVEFQSTTVQPGQLGGLNGARSPTDEHAILEANLAIETAALNADTSVVRQVYAEDFVSITQDGEVRTRDDRIASLASGEIRYESIVDDDVHVRLLGSVAVVTGRATVRAHIRGQERQGAVRYTRVYAEQNQQWRLVSQQLTRVVDSRPAAATKTMSSNSIRRIGILSAGFNAEVTLAPGSPRLDTLRAALGRLGYRDGREVVFITRVLTGGEDSLTRAGRELVDDSVDLIVAGGSTEALMAEHVTSRIPIVFWSGEPIAEGLVNSLARPGRNATGVIPMATMEAQRLQMLSLVAPGSAPIGVLYNPTYLPGVGIMQRTRRAADSLGIRLDLIEAQSLPQMDSAFAAFNRHGVRAVLINNHGFFRINAAYLTQLSLRYKLPMLSPYPEARDAGALVSSVPDFLFWSRRAAAYADRILRGADPAELAVEQSVPQHFTVNLKTAAALGITVPEEAMVRAQPIR